MKYLSIIIIVLFFISCNSKSSKTEHRYMIEVTEYFADSSVHGRVYHDSKKTTSHRKYSFNDTLKGYYDMYSCVYNDSILRANTGIDSVQIEIYER